MPRHFTLPLSDPDHREAQRIVAERERRLSEPMERDMQDILDSLLVDDANAALTELERNGERV